MRRFKGYDVRNTIVVYENGAFRSYRSWVTGWHRLLEKFGNCKYIIGTRGDPETEVTWDEISAFGIFIVLPETAEEQTCLAAA